MNIKKFVGPTFEGEAEISVESIEDQWRVLIHENTGDINTGHLFIFDTDSEVEAATMVEMLINRTLIAEEEIEMLGFFYF